MKYQNVKYYKHLPVLYGFDWDVNKIKCKNNFVKIYLLHYGLRYQLLVTVPATEWSTFLHKY